MAPATATHYTIFSADTHAGANHETYREYLDHGAGEAELRRILAGNAAKLYGFDLDKLAELAEQYGPIVEEIAVPLDVLPENPESRAVAGRRQCDGVKALIAWLTTASARCDRSLERFPRSHIEGESRRVHRRRLA
jgi:hypothetical protein